MACEARSNDARDAKRMAWGCAGGAKGVRMAVRGACGAEISRQCVGREARGLDNVGELQAVRACRMGLSKSPKSLRYNFPAPVCGAYPFTSSQVDAVLDLSEIESASPFEFITQTFAVFRVEVACEARSNDARDAKRMAQGCAREGRRVRRRDAQAMRGLRCARRGGVWVGRRALEWPCAKHAAQRCAWVEQRVAWTKWANYMRRRDTQAMRGSLSAWLE